MSELFANVRCFVKLTKKQTFFYIQLRTHSVLDLYLTCT
jgi:hypothetical protein